MPDCYCPICADPVPGGWQALGVHVANHEREDRKRRECQEKRAAIGRRYGDDHELEDPTSGGNTDGKEV